MQNLFKDINMEKYEVGSHRIGEEYQELCLEASEWFPKQHNSLIWSLPHQSYYTDSNMRYALSICKENNIKNPFYLRGILIKRA